MIEKITKTIYRCTCELDGCGKSWESHNPCPNQCRWCGSRKWNGQDKSIKHLVTANGKTLQVSEWSVISGLSRATITARLRLGWTPEDAVSLPVSLKNKYRKLREDLP
jgi:hypothetical protein